MWPCCVSPWLAGVALVRGTEADSSTGPHCAVPQPQFPRGHSGRPTPTGLAGETPAKGCSTHQLSLSGCSHVGPARGLQCSRPRAVPRCQDHRACRPAPAPLSLGLPLHARGVGADPREGSRGEKPTGPGRVDDSPFHRYAYSRGHAPPHPSNSEMGPAPPCCSDSETGPAEQQPWSREESGAGLVPQPSFPGGGMAACDVTELAVGREVSEPAPRPHPACSG